MFMSSIFPMFLRLNFAVLIQFVATIDDEDRWKLACPKNDRQQKRR